MTRIDFHTKVADPLAYTCRLVRTASRGGWTVVIQCDGEEQLAKLDNLLWTFSDQEFLPHVRAADPLAEHTPIILTSQAQDTVPQHRQLVTLTSGIPVHFARYERLVEIVAADPAALAAGRERFAHYKQRGYPLTHHDRSSNEQSVS